MNDMNELTKHRLRRKDRAITKAEVDQILQTGMVGRLGLSRNNQPYIVPLNFAYQDGHVFFHSAETGMMIDFLRSNASVCFEVDEHIATVPAATACQYDTAYRSVIAFGTARIMTNLEERTAALRLIAAKYAGREHAEELTARTVEKFRSSRESGTVVVDLVVDRVTGKAFQPKEPSQ